ncbi:PAS domain S-box protein [Pseudorhodobacter turbinis]|uniref:histidine kinase n=1 Tax=Pseudorhodobacter turbinis TaxID=2500533 RepID=A0A4P8EDF8_9RHOB|nr:PAS domain S-box protein [Pseudorhodobacter turbinis]QCO54395.1 PAS domain S-box protein [Pseudorhodobacter turbinis]
MLSNDIDLKTLIGAFDWSSTSLGPKTDWPAHIRSAVALILHAKIPMVTLWGQEGIMIYNDAYAEFALKRHPASLGAPVREAWPEVAEFNDGILKTVLAGGSTSFKDQEFSLLRKGIAEQLWLDLDYSPVIDDAGSPVGVFAIVTETTAKVKAERRLAAERDRLRQMFEQAPGFIAVLDGANHRFEITNAAYRQLIGHRDVVGLPVRNALPELVGQGFYELLDNVYNTGESFIGSAMPVLLKRSSDATAVERFVDFIFQPMRDADGYVGGIFVQGTDITERIATERALQVSERQFRTFAEAMPNHVWSAGPDGQLDWFNDRVYEYSGTARGDLDHGAWVRLLHPEDVAEAVEVWGEAVATGESYEIEFRLRRADGTWRWHLSRAEMLRDEDGEPHRWVGTNTDIEDQKRDRQQLQDSERRLRLSQQAAGIASIEIDLATDCILASDSFWTMFGLANEGPVSAKDIEALVVPEDRHLISTAQSRLTGTAALDATYRIKRASTDDIRWIARHIEVLRGQDGAPAKIYGALRDVTHEKLAEERQIMLTHELEHRIKNILATVSAIASQTLRNTDIETGRNTLSERFQALGKAHSLLSNTHWTSAVLADVVRVATVPLPVARIDLAGPFVQLGPKQALSLALAVNELGTNSLKYGALSVPEGRVNIAWSRSVSGDGEEQLRWSWTESGGPEVTAPTRRGFGRVLIEQVLAGDFNGTVRIQFDTSGVECVLEAPMPDLTSDEQDIK